MGGKQIGQSVGQLGDLGKLEMGCFSVGLRSHLREEVKSEGEKNGREEKIRIRRAMSRK